MTTSPKILQSYCFDDMLLRPSRSHISSRSQVNLETELGSRHRNLKLNIPLISSPMDTVTGERMAIKMALLGGIGIIHRYMSLEDQLAQVANVKRYVNYIFMEPYTINAHTTVSSAHDTQEENGVSTLCVLDDENTFVGLVTQRDLLNKPPEKRVCDIMTPVHNLYRIVITPELATELQTVNPADPIFADIMARANDLMNTYAIEKIPLFIESANMCTESANMCTESANMFRAPALFGLVTRRSVQHYFDNQSSASLDSRGRLRVGASIGIRPGFLEHTAKLVESGVDIVCVDVANGHNSGTLDAVRQLRVQFPDLVIMAGNICTLEGYIDLVDAGADCIRVGIGNGSICTTRLETGAGFGQWSALQECADYIFAHPDYAQMPKLICDGGTLNKTGNKVKALAIGASAIMMGRTLGSCDESPGQVIHRNGKRMKYFRGMASTMANLSKQESQQTKQTSKRKLDTEFTAEGVDGVVELKGSVQDVINQITGGLRSGLSYQGSTSIIELHGKYASLEWGLCTAIGLSETGIRVTTL